MKTKINLSNLIVGVTLCLVGQAVLNAAEMPSHCGIILGLVTAFMFPPVEAVPDEET